MLQHLHFYRIVSWLVEKLFLLTLSLYILGMLGRFWWVFDLLSHFREYFSLSLLLCVTLFVILKNRLLFSLSLAALCFSLLGPLSFYLPHKINPRKVEIRTITVFTANILGINRESQNLLDEIAKYDPDIIVLQEVRPWWSQELAPLEIAYPYTIQYPRDDNFGLQIMSKLPLTDEKIFKVVEEGTSSILTTVVTGHGDFKLLTTHPFPPVSSELKKLRDEQLIALTKVIQQQRLPLILVGDLNSTPYSFPYRYITRNGLMQNCAMGFGVKHTWNLFTVPPISIWIDHCLHTDGIEVISSKVGNSIGSDHLPIINQIYLE